MKCVKTRLPPLTATVHQAQGIQAPYTHDQQQPSPQPTPPIVNPFEAVLMYLGFD